MNLTLLLVFASIWVLDAFSVQPSVKRFLRGDKKAAMESLVKYCRAGGKILRGLQIRRLDERALFEGK
jgi:GH24 family phage-related lysozyme (muramidase)